MKYLSVKEVALIWNTSERSVRNYCAAGRVPGAFLRARHGTSLKTLRSPKEAIKVNLRRRHCSIF